MGHSGLNRIESNLNPNLSLSVRNQNARLKHELEKKRKENKIKETIRYHTIINPPLPLFRESEKKKKKVPIWTCLHPFPQPNPTQPNPHSSPPPLSHHTTLNTHTYIHTSPSPSPSPPKKSSPILSYPGFPALKFRGVGRDGGMDE